MDFDILTSGLKNGWDAFKNNIVAYVLGLLIAVIGSILIVTIAPLVYGLSYMAVKGARGEKVEITDIFYGFKSVSAFIRSWMYYIVYVVVIIIIAVITYLLTMVSPFLSIIGTLLSVIWALVTFYSMYIYVMTPSENAVYAYKEGFNVLKENLIMTILAYIVVYLLAVIGAILLGIGLLVTIPIAFVFTVSVLKALKPGIDAAN
ncbi:hypothetical protein MmiEs2_00980 [Methanimicrococcus stummii]|uniref:DUF4013 domain-containing protein n=1 Tax=Methanimicrococcus stummii TaxID=3028294 RepID=A0AA96ZWL5_9EURY|nr:hypothetical protein [Methanimicrococcus sp. Es2]WNY27919.1 hypothetical protein MmiEs2_00980 [Methanimicrococcus sp. Es2]